MKDSHKRSPGFFERQYICRNTKKYYNNFNVTSEYNHHISPILLSNTLRKLVLNNHVFALNFFRLSQFDAADDHQENGHNYEVRVINLIEFEDVVSYRQISGKFDDECLVELNLLRVPMNDEKTPLWRVIVWENKEQGSQFISFYCDHALFDGTSGVQFHRDLIKELATLSNGGNTEENLKFIGTIFDYGTDSDEIPDSIDDALENKVEIYHRPVLSKIWLWLKKTFFATIQSVFPFLFKSGIGGNVFEHKSVGLDFGHKYKIINFSPAEVDDILTFCRSQGITITPYMLSVGTRCLERTVFHYVSSAIDRLPAAGVNNAVIEGNAHKNEGIATASDGSDSFTSISKVSVNGRRHFPDHEHSLKYGVCVSTTSLPLPSLGGLDDIELLCKVKSVGEAVRIASNDKSIFWSMGDYLKSANFWDFFQNKLGRKERDTLYTSNLGRVSIQESDWEVKDIWFSQSNGLVFHFVFSVVSSPKGGLNIGFGYLPEYDEFGCMDEFVTAFKRDMLTIGR